jgi:[acyl-carrier-protein] S-malonyltransferase
MGRDLAGASAAAAAIFATADEALGESISSLAFEGPEDRLNRTENAQPALLATSIAYLAAAHERASAAGMTIPNPLFYAGHSMGQYSAMVASSAISLPDGVRLVRERGRLMQASGAGRDGAPTATRRARWSCRASAPRSRRPPRSRRSSAPSVPLSSP